MKMMYIVALLSGVVLTGQVWAAGTAVTPTSSASGPGAVAGTTVNTDVGTAVQNTQGQNNTAEMNVGGVQGGTVAGSTVNTKAGTVVQTTAGQNNKASMNIGVVK
ncbi:MAG: hypothetical protein HQL58_06515 [Magnetococcales bacterium]|nr:hypothetical protein [Magnetococcales bacterium]